MASEYNMTASLGASIDFVSLQSCKIIQMVNMVSSLCPSCKVTEMVKLRPLLGSIKARRAINTYYLTSHNSLSDKCFQAVIFYISLNYSTIQKLIYWFFTFMILYKSFVFPLRRGKKMTSIIKLSEHLKNIKCHIFLCAPFLMFLFSLWKCRLS